MPKNSKRILLGTIFLTIGIAIYFITIKLPNPSVINPSPVNELFVADQIWTIIRNYVPDLVHPLSFTLLIGGVLNLRSTQSYLLLAVIWFSINLFFEIGQKYPDTVINTFEALSSNNLLAVKTRAYFANGVFDWFDILAFFMGSILSIMILRKT